MVLNFLFRGKMRVLLENFFPQFNANFVENTLKFGFCSMPESTNKDRLVTETTTVSLI